MGRPRTWTDQQLRVAVRHGHSASDALRRLHLAVGGAARNVIFNHIDRLGLSISHWSRRPTGRKRSWTDQQLRGAVKQATSVTDTLRKLGLAKDNSYSRKLVRRRIRELGLDISHFKNWCHLKGLPLRRLLIRDSRAHNTHLKERLIRAGILEPRCDWCGRKTWRKLPIPLELDHINGDSHDNRRRNLRLLCPNCHAQTPTWKGRRSGYRSHQKSGQPPSGDT